MRKTKLIVLRGPSGSGKSTSAKALFEMATNPIALIDQDHYRFIFKPAGGGSKANSDTIHKMIKGDVLIALNDGYDVILEGILSVKSYGGLLDGIFAAHKGENYMYYFDISFEETVRRYHTKPDAKKKEFSEEDTKISVAHSDQSHVMFQKNHWISKFAFGISFPPEFAPVSIKTNCLEIFGYAGCRHVKSCT
jgi:adenylate kinase family enzyme